MSFVEQVKVAQVLSSVSAANSSTTPLNSGATFTGTSVDLITLGYVSVQTEIFTDKAGTLQIQFSTDNSNWDHVVTVAVPASASTSVATGIHGRYARVVMTNTAGTNQTLLRLQTILIPGSISGTVKDLESPVTTDDNALITHGVITGVTTGGGGGFVDVKVNPSGALAVAANITGNNGGILDAAPGATAPANGLQVGGTDGTNFRAIKTDTSGDVFVRQATPTTSNLSQAAVSFSASGANVIVAGVGGQTVRIFRMLLVVGAATNLTIQDTTPTNFSGAIPLAANGGLAFQFEGEPHYISAVGKGIQINNSNAVQVSGTVWYTQS